jgi:uncharacterized membrane protein YeaQ/YmgE (transglycosylase-associated protein family)
MELAIALGIGGWILLIGGALVIGVVAQFIGEPNSGYEWVATSIAAGLGALIASEFIVGLRTFEPVWDGLAMVPAAVGGVVLAALVAVAARYVTGGTTAHRPMSA